MKLKDNDKPKKPVSPEIILPEINDKKFLNLYTSHIPAGFPSPAEDFMEKLPRNVSISPRVERSKMPEIYQRSKYFIRYTRHDSESLSVFEALYFNLQVLWTYDFPHTIKIESQEKLSDSIPSLVKNWESNYPGHEYVLKNFSIEKWRTDFLKVIHSKLPKK